MPLLWKDFLRSKVKYAFKPLVSFHRVSSLFAFQRKEREKDKPTLNLGSSFFKAAFNE